MRDAAFVKACELVVEFRKQASHWKKLLCVTSDELSAACEDLQKDQDCSFNNAVSDSIRKILGAVEGEFTIHAAERLRSEVESLRAKLASRTVEWPEWAKEGTRVRVRSTHSSITQAAQYCVGDEFVIEELDEDDWSANAGGRWAFLGDLEPVAEHAQPAVAVQS